MKYIRTKDGKIFSVLVSDQLSKDEVTMDIIGFRIQNALKQNKCIAKKDNILKIADTIEELCDEFVEIHGDCKELVDLSRVAYYTKITLGEYYLNRIANRKALGSLIDDKDKDIKLYGAVWTDKGLIYVAKLNDKGELELI